MISEPVLSSNVVVQVGIVVRDSDRARELFARILGTPVPEVIETSGFDQARTVYRGRPTEARAKLAFFHTGQCAIELIEPIGGPSTWREQLENHGNSIHHIAFQIRGMERTLGALESLGAETVQRGEYTGGRYAYVDATEAVGAVLELLEND